MPFRDITNRNRNPDIRRPGWTQSETCCRSERSGRSPTNNRLRTKQSGAKRMGSGVEQAGRTDLPTLRFRESSPEDESGMGAMQRLAMAPFGCSALSMSCMESSVFESARPCQHTTVSSHACRPALSRKSGDRCLTESAHAQSVPAYSEVPEPNAGPPADRSCAQPALQQRIVRPLSRAEDMQGGYGATMNVLP